MVACPCCIAGTTPEVAYIKFIGLTGRTDGGDVCDTPCEGLNDVCFEINRTGACSWSGTITQHATCFPTSTVNLTLTCSAGLRMLTLNWVLGPGAEGTAVYRWQQMAPGAFDCTECQTYELNRITFDTGGPFCDTQFSFVQVRFDQPNEGCCHHCPSRYQLHFQNFFGDFSDPKCGSSDCVTFFGNNIYLLDFVGSNRRPAEWVTCSFQGTSDWCEWMVHLTHRCSDVRYGFCSIHLFIRTRDDCSLDIVVEVRYDDLEFENCGATDRRQAWSTKAGGHIFQKCTQLDHTLIGTSRCVDKSWNCNDHFGATIRIQSV